MQASFLVCGMTNQIPYRGDALPLVYDMRLFPNQHEGRIVQRQCVFLVYVAD